MYIHKCIVQELRLVSYCISEHVPDHQVFGTHWYSNICGWSQATAGNCNGEKVSEASSERVVHLYVIRSQ